jgi:4-hydroxy-tetrahydrodipicolinate reductase
MKIALIGYGKMGRAVEAAAGQVGIEIVERYWDERPFEVTDETRQKFAGVDVLVEFTTPETVMDHIAKSAEMGKPIVVGTTGWHDRLDKVRRIVEEAGIGLVYASNFSLGMQLFYRLAREAGRLFSAFEDYDPFMEEAHHQFKKDAPSGTALVLRSILESSYPEKTIPISCVRAGFIPGTHAVSFDSRVDTIRLEHTARSRDGLAEGAVLAAQWIAGKTGFYEYGEIVDSILAQHASNRRKTV